MLLVPLSNPASVGGRHCWPYPEKLIANQEYNSYFQISKCCRRVGIFLRKIGQKLLGYSNGLLTFFMEKPGQIDLNHNCILLSSLVCFILGSSLFLMLHSYTYIS